MAEAQRSAFQANLDQLVTAIQANDDEAAKAAVMGVANLVFHSLDRIADALERIAEAEEKAERSTWHTTRFAGRAPEDPHPASAAARERQARGGIGP